MIHARLQLHSHYIEGTLVSHLHKEIFIRGNKGLNRCKRMFMRGNGGQNCCKGWWRTTTAREWSWENIWEGVFMREHLWEAIFRATVNVTWFCSATLKYITSRIVVYIPHSGKIWWALNLVISANTYKTIFSSQLLNWLSLWLGQYCQPWTK